LSGQLKPRYVRLHHRLSGIALAEAPVKIRTKAVSMLILAILCGCHSQPEHSASERRAPATWRELAALDNPALGQVAISRMNLLCASGVSDSQSMDVDQVVGTIHSWADRVRSETERHIYRFRNNPAEFENSEAFFRMLMLTVVLAEDFHVQYDPARMSDPKAVSDKDGFFSDPDAVFLPGLLGPQRIGTCSSMPVLYVAVGRELGYPLYLVTTKGHLFVRWEGGGERFNIEATSHGLSRFDDDYYRHWPYEVTAEEERNESYLKSLSPSEELAVFLSIRGMCLRERGQFQEAAESFSQATKFAPAVHSYRLMLADLQKQISPDTSKSDPQTKTNQLPL
jgi:hypothetical protein